MKRHLLRCLRKPLHLFLLALLACLPAMNSLAQVLAAQAPKTLEYRIVEDKPHDPGLFTQGLLLQGDLLVESSGGYGQSLIRRYRADTGALVNQKELPAQVFAEGLAQVNEQLYLLTWREELCFVVNADSLELEGKHRFDGEGWGLAYDGSRLIMSDGSSKLRLHDPNTFSVVDTLTVTGAGQPWHKLNELEYARGMIWANVWQDNRILAIHPQSGTVLGILDLTELAKINSTRPGHSVLNGIAYDPVRQAFWVTGKLWPRRYLLEIIWPKASNETATSGNQPEQL